MSSVISCFHFECKKGIKDRFDPFFRIFDNVAGFG